MNSVLKTATVLSWINIVITGFILVFGLFNLLLMPNLYAFLILIVLPASIILHSYATLQLRRSILDPNIVLDNQTPVGIRMIGFIALFFAILCISLVIPSIQSASELATQAPEELITKMKKVGVDYVAYISAILRLVGIFILFFAVSVATNVFLSIRLLRWYLGGKPE